MSAVKEQSPHQFVLYTLDVRAPEYIEYQQFGITTLFSK